MINFGVISFEIRFLLYLKKSMADHETFVQLTGVKMIIKVTYIFFWPNRQWSNTDCGEI
jgi:hypothetical protein